MIRHRTFPRRMAFRAAALTIASVVALLVGEVGVRVYLAAHPPRLRLDEKLGWRCVEGYSWSGEVQDAAGAKRRITYTTDRHGFRTWGDLATRPRILVLGDSFTQAVAASDDETYHALLAKELGASVFAYGAGGYGTLQELLVLDEVLDEIHPDRVLLQFCTNDFINNDAALERASRWDNNGMRRPYLADDGSVRYETPKPLASLRALGESSRLVFGAFVLWDRLGARWGYTVEPEIAREGASHPGFAHASAVTERLLRRIRERCGTTPLAVFCADGREPYRSELERILERSGIEYLDGIPEALEEESRRGGVVLAADHGHWNDKGHRVVATALARRLRASELPHASR